MMNEFMNLALRSALPGSPFRPDRAILAAYDRWTTQSIPSGASWTVADFNQKVVDTHNAVVTGAAWKFTAPAARHYIVVVSIIFTSATWATGQVGQLGVLKNGSTAKVLWREANNNLTNYIGSGTRVAIVPAAVGDELQIGVQQTTGVSINLEANGQFNFVAILGLAGV